MEIGQTIKIGYFGQENEALDESKRVLDYIKDVAEFIRTPEGLISATIMCERFLFTSDMQYSPIAKLSGGEKRRLYLLRVLMEAPNVIILDEPTNDLDIQTLRILEDYLDRFPGIILTVSHDRYFLDRVVTRIFSFEGNGMILQSEGGYSDYIFHKNYAEDNINEFSNKSVKNSKQQTVSEDASEKTLKNRNRTIREKTKLSFSEQKEYDTIESEIEKLEIRYSETEKQISESATDFTQLMKLEKEKEELEAAIETKMERYIELQDMVDSFKKL